MPVCDACSLLVLLVLIQNVRTFTGVPGSQTPNTTLVFCCRYTLLVGKPPFETSSLKDTYARIKKNEYTIPSRVCTSARGLIQRLLQPDPAARPSMEQVLDHEFFVSGL